MPRLASEPVRSLSPHPLDHALTGNNASEERKRRGLGLAGLGFAGRSRVGDATPEFFACLVLRERAALNVRSTRLKGDGLGPVPLARELPPPWETVPSTLSRPSDALGSTRIPTFFGPDRGPCRARLPERILQR